MIIKLFYLHSGLVKVSLSEVKAVHG